MWFKNLTLYKLAQDFQPDFMRLADALQTGALRPCGSQELRSLGFVSPMPEGCGDALIHAADGAALIALGCEERVLPSTVVRDALRARIQAHRQRTGHAPGKRVRDLLKDEVLHELLPRAFVKRSRVDAYIDTVAGLLVVNTASDKPGEALLKLLLETLGLPVAHEPLLAKESVSGVMTRWMSEERAGEGFDIGDDVDLKDPLDRRAQVKVRKHDLGMLEATELVRGGNSVDQLELIYDHRLRFALGSNLKVRKLRFLDLVQEQLGDTAEDAAAELDARFTLQVLELRRLFDALDQVLGFV